HLLAAMVAEGAEDQAVDRLPLLDEAERHQVLTQWNATKADYPRDACVHALFEAQVARDPSAIAIVQNNVTLTYGELNARSNQLAHYLRELGVRPDDRVAVCVQRSVEMVVALLAVLKAGGAYVPLDPAYPSERLAYMQADCGALAMLTDTASRQLIEDITTSVVIVDLQTDSEHWAHLPDSNPDRYANGLTASHLAYVIYTSGSTGVPKGVMTEHRNVVGLFGATEERFEFSSDDVWTLFHSYAFDFSVWEIFGALLYGGRLVVVPWETARSPDAFHELVCRESVTVLNQTPSAFKSFIAAQGSSGSEHCLRMVIFGGEALDVAALKPWFERERNLATHLVNMYGITETTVHVTWRSLTVTDVDWRGGSPIGRPIANTRTYILDGHGAPVPIGVVGELYIGGEGVARGYLNREDLTAARFIADPFSDTADARMYRSGDLGRWRTDGTIEYVGRNDHQVKIRGFRIELGEIEARLSAHADVRECVVVALEGAAAGTEKRLVAYWVAAGHVTSEPLGAESLRSWLSDTLPDYMVPAAYVQLDRLPLTPNGKLDHKALPAPDGSAYAAPAYEAPQGAIEQTIAAIWCDLLGLESIGRHDNFFALGGHSLLVVTLTERMRQQGFHADLRTLFANPTLAALAAASGGLSIIVPPNRIEPDSVEITPEMLPLVELTQQQIDSIVAMTPGGSANIQDIYPLAPLQEGIFFHHLLQREGDAYLLPNLIAFDSRSRLDVFVDALQCVIDRHDILRTAVLCEGLAAPVQVVWRHAPLLIEEVCLDGACDNVAELLQSRFDPSCWRMDVRQAPLMRGFAAYDPASSRWLLQLLSHHLALDHTTLEIVLDEIRCHLCAETASLPAPLPFRNFVAQAFLGVSVEEHEAYFRTMLGDVDEPCAPFGLLDVQGDGSDVEEVRIDLSDRLSALLRSQARALGVSVASLFHLAWAQVVARTTGHERVVFGTVLFGRMQGGAGADRTLGIFINTLPLRIEIDDVSVVESVRIVQQRLAGLLRHEHAPLSLVQRCSGVPAPAPLFTSLLNYRYSVQTEGSAETMAWDGIERISGHESTNYPLGVSVDDVGFGFSIKVQTQRPLVPARICTFLVNALEGLADALAHAPETAVRDLDVLPEAERHQVLMQWNATTNDYPREACVHELFEAQVARTPSAIAVVQGEVSLTYRELNARANGLAHSLRELGVCPDDRVAICMQRSVEMVVAVLAVLKAGGAYVPLDPAYPVERLAYMLEDSAPVAVLAQTSTLNLLLTASAPIINLDESHWQDRSVSNLSMDGLTSTHLAYVIYTSGSTGRPKGVMIEHRNTVNLLAWAQRSFAASVLEKVLFSTSLNFDLSVYECFVPLVCGGAIEVVDNLLAMQADGQGVTLINTTPSALKGWLESGGRGEGVHTVNVCGEVLKRQVVEDLFAKTQIERLCNLYGPSETTTYSSWVSMERSDGFVSHIGTPLDNTQFYVLDTHRQPVPVGVTGELYIGGAGVARGYLNRGDLTAARFLMDPFSADPTARMYRTGDLGRWRADGTLEFVGRNDHQVKIRGFRIELGEIEARLSAHVDVRECVVVALEDATGSDKRLVAYWVGAQDATHESLGVESLRSWLSDTLPDYMVPAAYVQLDRLPLTPNGKLDRKSLPAPDATAYAAPAYEAPQGEVEHTIAAIWRELLGLESIGRHDNFFALGGHSLLAVRVASRLRQELGVEIGVAELFANATLKDLAACVASSSAAILPAILPLQPDAPRVLSFAQQRLWFLSQFEGVSEAYHISGGLRLRGVLDVQALQRALDRIVARHASLRTSFALVDGQALQHVADEDSGFHLIDHDLREVPDREAVLEQLLAEEVQTPFALEQG
ncbi:non-ribosomal peptide synthetase, partial [Xanthomonas sp. GPE 39]|uniref:non-ribosomal peptide synthetase n=1 Tax=Xanthomonas sp. GPE 39 TaxID=1583099 RepID=UPI0013793992